MAYPLLAALCVLVCHQAAIAQAQGDCGMTPRSLETDFLTNCQEIGMESAPCTQAWNAFMGAFAGIAPGNVNASGYEPYFDVIPIEAVANASLFWSRTMPLVNVVSMMNAMGVNVVSSLNTDASVIFNRLGSINWCGIENGGIDFTNNCSCRVTGEFWFQFSVEFAQAASGSIFFLTDGENVTFSESSFFARAELPNLQDDSVTRVVVLDVHREGVGESCSDRDGSLQRLRDLIGDRPFSFDCYDIYGQASNTMQTETIANCTRTVVDDVQQGTESEQREIQCAGAGPLQVSLVLLLFSLILPCIF